MKAVSTLRVASLVALIAASVAFAAETAAAIVPSTAKELIDFRDLAKVRSRRPILIAHRGGVVTSTIPECSLAAIREACGRDATIDQLTEAEARRIRYLKNDELIANLDEALALCRKQNLQRAGALVVPALNPFRHDKDVARQQARDDAYQDFFGRPLP